MRTAALAFGLAAMLSCQTAVAAVDGKVNCSQVRLVDILQPYLTKDGSLDPRYFSNLMIGHTKLPGNDGNFDDALFAVKTFSLPSVGDVDAFYFVDNLNQTGGVQRNGREEYYPVYYFSFRIVIGSLHFINPDLTRGIDGDEFVDLANSPACRE